MAGLAFALLRDAASRLRAAGVASPEVDARLLLAWAMGLDTWQLATEPVSDAAAGRFAGLVKDRCDGRPLQYLTGVAHFRRVRLSVGPGVFIPRPETETMVGWVLERLPDLDAPVVVDLCAGSGAISAAIADEHAGCLQYAVEADPAAFDYLQRNLVGTGVHLVRADIADALRELDGQVDVVIANPPYVPERDRAAVARDVATHEPPQAVFAGFDGLDVVKVVATVAARLLRAGGLLACEHDESQGSWAPAIFGATGAFADVTDHDDLAGRPRFVTARRAGVA